MPSTAPSPEGSAARPGIAERLSRMIRLPTASAELGARGRQPFEDFVALLPELYPLCHDGAPAAAGARTSENVANFGR